MKSVIKLHSKTKHVTVNHCSTCASRRGDRCVLLGSYISIYKETSKICGIENQGYTKKLGLFKRIKIYLLGCD